MTDMPAVGSLIADPELDHWLAVSRDGEIIVRTGKAELGQGIRTALVAIAADELSVEPTRITVKGPSTRSSPDEGVTSGSRSIEQSGMAIRQVCAHARRLLLQLASVRLGQPIDRLSVVDGTVRDERGHAVGYCELLGGRRFGVTITTLAEPLPPSQRRYSGHGLTRVDLASKMRGDPVFVHDLALPGMRHARVLRPPRPGARVVGRVPVLVGVADVIRSGSFIAVVADHAGDAVYAAQTLAPLVVWEGGGLPNVCSPTDHLLTSPSEPVEIVDGWSVEEPVGEALDCSRAEVVVRARYTKPFILHGSLGPSAAVAWYADRHLTVWSHTQGVGRLRDALAEVLGIVTDAVTVSHVEGAGCYGHNGADDAALDAALIAFACPGRPVSLAWTRADESGWEPVGSAMVVDLAAGLRSDGSLESWQHDVYTYSHIGRPRLSPPGTSNLLGSWYVARPLRPTERRPTVGFHIGGHRNADPIYRVPERRIVKHFVAEGLLRTSSTRSLGAFANVFAIESFVDELADRMGVDPVAFRLAHLDDPRAAAVIEAVVELAGGLTAPGGLDAPGRGLAFARYENAKAYAAVVVEATVDPRTGEVGLRRAWIAADAGEVIDPDGLTNQLEGGFVQAASWTLKEEVGFDQDGVTTRDWHSYPILRFSEVPEVTTRLIDRGDLPPLGAGEAVTGPTAAAIANAVFQATGVRLRDLPLRPARVLAALEAALLSDTSSS